MKAVVVGGGIGGLATAAAFHRQGWDIEVLERAAEFAEVGAGLTIQPNGLRALDLLRIGDVRRTGRIVDPPSGIRAANGTWLIRNDVGALKHRFGQWVTVHRAELIEMLLTAIPADTLRAGAEVRQVHPDGTVTHTAGTTSGDLVVGADGLRSITRSTLWPTRPEPRYAGYTTWRFLAESRAVSESVETWGSGARFGQVPMPDGRVYCYAMANAPAGSRMGAADLRERFQRWHEPIPALLEAVEDDAVLQHDTYELPALPSFVTGRVALLGDAAHAMTPNLGQGACQALEDAATLVEKVTALGLDAGLAAYDRARRTRTRMVVRRSRQAGAPAHWTNPVLTALRDATLPRLPGAVFGRSITPAYAWPNRPVPRTLR
ncbi:FAD-dependent monooxygenase [Nocardia carnea]|uniref:FAD-dependent monooxygenase n=1 Tax=Nocardia carnea TaxID=37328 RepID=UPI002456BB92|nr:FAD-dependent monooxygenase [Nocardia carnea]